MAEATRPDVERDEAERHGSRERYQPPALAPAGRLEPRLQGSPPEPPPWP